MLSKFEVENFRGFKNRLVFDLQAGVYEFNPSLVQGGVVKNALIFGRNGSGKSAIGLAIFDIIRHLTDKEQIFEIHLHPYRNLSNDSKIVSFKYEFLFAEGRVVYAYEKTDPDRLVHEALWFDDTLVLDWNYQNEIENAFDQELLGSVNLAKRGSGVSVLKYLYRTQKSASHPLVARLMTFVENMLWFRSVLGGPNYAGFKKGVDVIFDEINAQGKLKDFMAFLAEQGLNYDLEFRPQDGREVLIAKYAQGEALFSSVASTGTLALSLFFYWSIAAFPSVSLLFVDEFDAGVHFESARSLLEKLNQSGRFQVVVTTHDTYLMQNALTRPDCCYIISGDRISPLCRATEKEIRQAHNLEKMYTHGVFRV